LLVQTYLADDGTDVLIRTSQILQLENLQMVNSIIVASIVTAATELTIKWNMITGVNDLTSAGQLIPFLIGVALVLRVVYVGFFRNGPDGETIPRRNPNSITGHVGRHHPGRASRHRSFIQREADNFSSNNSVPIVAEPARAGRRSRPRYGEIV